MRSSYLVDGTLMAKYVKANKLKLQDPKELNEVFQKGRHQPRRRVDENPIEVETGLRIPLPLLDRKHTTLACRHKFSLLINREPLANWSKLWLVAMAGFAALSILTLLGMIIWMSLRTGVPGQPSDYTLKNYAALLGDPYTYRVMSDHADFSRRSRSPSRCRWDLSSPGSVERTDMPYKTVAMSVLSIGILFPTFLKAMGWVFLLHPRIGVINIFLMQLFGLTNAPLNIATRPRNRFRARHDPDAAGLRDDLGGLAQHESGAGRSRQRARREPVAHAGAHRAAAHLAGAVFGGHLDAHGGHRRLRRARRDRHGQ